MKQTLSKRLRPGESHLPWMRDLKANVAMTDDVRMGPVICIRERDGWGTVETELTCETSGPLMLAYLTFQG